MKGTWQTSSHGSGTAALAVLVIVGLAAGSGAAARAVHVADELLHAVLITVAVLAGIAIAGVAGLIVWQIRGERRVHGPRVVVQSAPLPKRTPPAVQRTGLPAPQVHLHVHGPVTPADIAAIIARPPAELHTAPEED